MKKSLTPIPLEQIVPDYTSNWLVHELLGLGDFSVVSGAPNTSKTFLALDIAMHIAMSKDWGGKRVEPGAVVYISCEGSRRFAYRVEAFRQKYGIDDAKASSIPFGLINVPVDLLNPQADLDEVIQRVVAFAAMRKQPLRMIVIDTLARAMGGGDENSPKDMGAFIQNVDYLRTHADTHVMVVHHIGKDAERGSRGHSSLLGAVDTEIRIQMNKNTKIASMRVVKQKDGEVGDQIHYNVEKREIGYDSQNLPISSCTVELTSFEPIAGKTFKLWDGQTQGEKNVDILLTKIQEQFTYKGMTSIRDDGLEVLPIGPLRETLYDVFTDSVTASAKKKAFYRAMNVLAERGDIVRHEGDMLSLCTKDSDVPS